MSVSVCLCVYLPRTYLRYYKCELHQRLFYLLSVALVRFSSGGIVISGFMDDVILENNGLE